MFKFAVVILAVVACTAAKPGLIGVPLAYNVPAAVVAAPVPASVVTATSSQYIARNHNGIASAPVIAPVAGPIVGNAVAAPFAFSAPLTHAAAVPVPAPVFL